MSHRISPLIQAIAILFLWTTACLKAANPVMPGADPHALVIDGTIWVYPTWSGGPGERFFAFSSTNLQDWQRHGPVLDFKDVAWIKDDGQERHHAWAPSVLSRSGKYFFYYSVGPQNPTPSRIGVAVGAGPMGPFCDSGKPLLTGGNGFEAIDPMVFTDPKSEKTYLYAGGSAGAKLRVFELNQDLISIAREIPVETPPKFTEGVFMHYRKGRYYLSYSHGSWRHSSYSVHYATADSPTGPWNYQGAILTSDATRKGPGHHSFIRHPLTEEWRIFYHRWENQTSDGPYRGFRQVCVDPMEFDPNGLILPIEMDGSVEKVMPFPAGASSPPLASVTPDATTPNSAAARITLKYENPVWDGYLADPQVLKTGNEYYAYGTGPEHEGRQFPVLHSKDFANWKFVGNALETLADPKVKAYWAPEVAEKDGKYYLYYAGEYKMRVAVADHPAGPFKDSGIILFPDEPFSIDGHPYRDPKSGQWYLFFAKDFLDPRVGTALAVAELSENMTSIDGPIRTVLRAIGDWQIYERNRTMYGKVFDAWHTVEAPFVVLREGRYYCFYSGGNWQTPGYGVGFAVSDQVMGPYKDEANLEGATVLGSVPGKLIGPGHNSVVLGPDNRTHFIVYHSWNPERTKRQMCLDPITWTKEGPRAYQPSRGKKSITLPFPATSETSSSQTAGSARGTFTNPINSGPDPWMQYFNGHYYLTTTQGDRIRMWKAATVAELKTEEGVTIWRDHDPSRSHGVWAPEFHFISNRWYLYYTAMAATKVDTTHRLHVLESEGTDPRGPYHYKGRIFDPANDFYAIDGSVFKHPGDDRWYFLWAAHPGHRIRIARMANPWTLEGRSVQLEASGFGCEEVREGPVVLRRNGRLFLTYSACDTGKPDYKIGMIIADEKADVMDPSSWVQYPKPVFERNDEAGVYGPGHHGFFQSPDGTEDWIVYHGKTSSSYTYTGRTTRVQKFTWNADGMPEFGKPLPLDAVLMEPSR